MEVLKVICLACSIHDNAHALHAICDQVKFHCPRREDSDNPRLIKKGPTNGSKKENAPW
jgi:hypothetical protein